VGRRHVGFAILVHSDTILLGPKPGSSRQEDIRMMFLVTVASMTLVCAHNSDYREGTENKDLSGYAETVEL
jgi:hypothetical protein